MTNEVAVRCRCGAVLDGTDRWYAECCNTPMGNTIPAIPFVGLARGAFEIPPEHVDETFGPKSIVNIDSAVGGARPGERFSAHGLLHPVWLILTWLVRRLGHPTPFFDRAKPTVTPRILTPAEREALRQHPRA